MLIRDEPSLRVHQILPSATLTPRRLLSARKPGHFIQTSRIKRQKGFSDLSAIRVPDGDEVAMLRSDTTQTLIVRNHGKAYTVRIDDITATTGYGDPIHSIFNFSDGERIIGVVSSDQSFILL